MKIYFCPSMKRVLYSVVVLVLLNLSAALNTVDRAFLLSRLHDMYRINDQALVLIKSYLSDRLRVNIIRELNMGFHRVLFSGRFCTVYIVYISLCLTSFTVLSIVPFICWSILLLKGKTVLLTNCLIYPPQGGPNYSS